MRLFLGSYAFDDNAVIIASHGEILKNRGGQIYARRVWHDVEGYLTGSSQSDITQAMSALQTALAKPFQDFVFKQSDGNESATLLKNAGSITGVNVSIGPDFTKSEGAEYVTRRHFTFRVEAEYPLSGTNNFLLSFTEHLDFWGGGPRFVHKEAVVGPVQKQQVREQTIYHAVQSGMSEGYRKEPSVPPPIWPGALIEANPRIRRSSPDRRGKGYERYGLTWEWRFESATPLTGLPHLWLN